MTDVVTIPSLPQPWSQGRRLVPFPGVATESPESGFLDFLESEKAGHPEEASIIQEKSPQQGGSFPTFRKQASRDQG